MAHAADGSLFIGLLVGEQAVSDFGGGDASVLFPKGYRG
ncbi:MAG: hypothetical protein ACI8PT_003035 [Gammaproteobacteria bacterium]|jgi:hypothetical protein